MIRDIIWQYPQAFAITACIAAVTICVIGVSACFSVKQKDGGE